MKYRAGRWTTGIALVFIGLLILLSQTTESDFLHDWWNLWPLILIGYGLEYLLAARKGEKVSFDIFGAVIIAVAIMATTAYSAVGSLGFDLGFFGKSYTFEDQPVVIDESAMQEISSFIAETKNGSIYLVPADDRKITIQAIYKLRGSNEEQARKRKDAIDLKVEQADEKVTARVVYPDKWFLGWIMGSVDLRVAVPANLEVNADTSNGEIHVSGMDNIRNITTSNGAIYVTDSNGRANLHTSNGRIEVRNFTGALQAKTSNGRVIASGEVNGDWQLKTSNGDIEVTIPTEGSYRYQFSTSNGSIEAPNPPFAGRESQKRYRGEVNGGRYKLEFSTSNGDIDVIAP
jgi:hypothetical protein